MSGGTQPSLSQVIFFFYRFLSQVIFYVFLWLQVYTSPQLSLFGLSVVPPLALLAAFGGRKLRGLSSKVQVNNYYFQHIVGKM